MWTVKEDAKEGRTEGAAQGLEGVPLYLLQILSEHGSLQTRDSVASHQQPIDITSDEALDETGHGSSDFTQIRLISQSWPAQAKTHLPSINHALQGQN